MSNPKQTKTTETLFNIVMVSFDKLVKDPDNVRQTRTDEGIEALADNIHAEGLLQNLMVREMKDGNFAVTGGERRRTALEILVKRKQMKPTDKVPCNLIESAHTSASLSENIHRLAMHPADQFLAWAKLQDEGLTISEIAKRHGATNKLVEQRLKLGRLSPLLLDALKADEIDVETACAFTISDDQQRQEAAFHALKTHWNSLNPRSVKAALTEDEIAGSNKLALFVGRDAYEKAGGEIRTDLFDEEVYFIDAELLTNLAITKLEAEAERLKADGWAWIEIALEQDYGAGNKMRKIHLHEIPLPAKEQAEKEQLEQRYKEIEEAALNEDEASIVECETIDERLDELTQKATAYKPEDQAISGGFLSIGYDGNINLKVGYIRPQDDQELTAAKRKSAEAKAAMPPQLSKALRNDLAAVRLEILQGEFLKNPIIARDLLAFHTIRKTILSGYTKSPFDLFAQKAEGAACISKNGDMGKYVGRQAAQKLTDKLPLACFDIKDVTASFEAFHALSEADKIGLQAYAAAQMLKPQLNDNFECEPTLERVAQLISVDVASYWTPNAEFFARITKKHMEEIAETVISPAFVQRHSKDKKSVFAEAIGAAFTHESKSSHVDQETAQRIASWVPPCMQS